MGKFDKNKKKDMMILIATFSFGHNGSHLT